MLDEYPLNFFGRPLLIKLQVAHVDVKEVGYSAPVIERFLRNRLVPDLVTQIDPLAQGLSGLIGPLQDNALVDCTKRKGPNWDSS